MIEFHSEEIDKPKLNFRKIPDWIILSIKNEFFFEGDISYIFCSDDYLLNINKEYLKHDFFTDIITFDYSEEKIISGDIFISVDRVNENADKYKISLENEFLRVIVHGVLHLMGYDDKNLADKIEMTKKEDFYINRYFKN